MSKSKQPSLILDAVIKSLEEATTQLRMLNGEAKREERVPPESKEPKVNHIKLGILAYDRLYFAKYSVNAYHSQSDRFTIGKLHKELGDEFETVLSEYFSIDNDKFLNDNGHAARFIPSKMSVIRQRLAGSTQTNSGGEWK